MENEKRKCRSCLKYCCIYLFGREFKCMNFENNQNAHFIMKDYSSVGQPQTFTLLLNLRWLSMVENMIWKYFYHSAFSWYTLHGFYSKVPSIRSRLSLVSHRNSWSTAHVCPCCQVGMGLLEDPGNRYSMVVPYREKWSLFLENTVVCWTNVTSILKSEMSTSRDSIKYPWFLLLWNKENLF